MFYIECNYKDISKDMTNKCYRLIFRGESERKIQKLETITTVTIDHTKKNGNGVVAELKWKWWPQFAFLRGAPSAQK